MVAWRWPLGGIVASLVSSVVLWPFLGLPTYVIAGAIPFGSALGPILIAVLLFRFRGPLTSALTGSVGRLAPAAVAVAIPLIATLLFEVSWAGAHFRQTADVGLVPQALFPAVVGTYALGVAVYGDGLRRALSGVFTLRDRIPTKQRYGAMIVLPMLVTFALAPSGKVAFVEQVTVLVGLLIGYVLLAPRAEMASSR